MKVLCSIDRAWSSNECACCDPELRAGLQPFALLMLFLCVILNNMWSGKSLQLVYCVCLPSQTHVTFLMKKT